jgi:hypothetical protein
MMLYTCFSYKSLVTLQHNASIDRSSGSLSKVVFAVCDVALVDAFVDGGKVR